MANRRMFSLKVVDTDAFLDMPQSSQLLYYSLAMRADDDGFISNPKKIMRMLGSQEDDYKVLVAKRFIIPFESGICVIKHWLIHNLIRSDRYTGTQWIKEKEQLKIDEKTSKYQLNSNVIPNDNQVHPQDRIGKDSLGEVKIEKNTAETSSASKKSFSKEGAEILKAFENINPSCKKYYNRPPQRQACDDLISTYGLDRVISVVEKTLPKTNGLQFFPTITTPLQLNDKWIQLESAIRKYQSEKLSTKEKYPKI